MAAQRDAGCAVSVIPLMAEIAVSHFNLLPGKADLHTCTFTAVIHGSVCDSDSFIPVAAGKTGVNLVKTDYASCNQLFCFIDQA